MTVEQLDTNYGLALAARTTEPWRGHAAGLLVAIFATPEHPAHLDDGEV